MLKIKNLKKAYGDKIVLDDIDLEISKNEFLVLVGPSGSGKSTLMRIIAGLEKEYSGDIALSKEDLSKLAPKERNISMVFQNYALYPHKTVFQNIAFPLKLLGKDKEHIANNVLDIAKKLSIEDLLERKPNELSGGQRQRVALARALIKNPSIFLMDEPLSNLDAKLRVQLRQEIFKLKSLSDSIFVYVTHDQIEALTLGDKIAVLNEGKIQQIASPQELYEKPANTFVASFIGSPPMNLIYSFNEDKILGFRPDDASLTAKDSNDQKFTESIKVKNDKDIKTLLEKYQSFREKVEESINIEFFVAENLLYYFNKSDNKLINP